MVFSLNNPYRRRARGKKIRVICMICWTKNIRVNPCDPWSK